jgi:hypothetical protein
LKSNQLNHTSKFVSKPSHFWRSITLMFCISISWWNDSFAQKIYRHVSPDGLISYSDQPASNGKIVDLPSSVFNGKQRNPTDLEKRNDLKDFPDLRLLNALGVALSDENMISMIAKVCASIQPQNSTLLSIAALDWKSRNQRILSHAFGLLSREFTPAQGKQVQEMAAQQGAMFAAMIALSAPSESQKLCSESVTNLQSPGFVLGMTPQIVSILWSYPKR